MNNLLGTPWTPEEDAALREYVKQAIGRVHYKTIGKQLNRTTKACCARARALGLRPGYARRAAAFALLAAGVRYMDVVRETGVSCNMLNKIKKEMTCV